MALYADTSILVPYYVPEPLSEAVGRERGVAISDLVEVEFFSSLARKVRENTLSMDDADRVGAQFLSHVADLYYLRYGLDRRCYQDATRWLAQRVGGLRTLDALHLALAHAQGLELWTADSVLYHAAREVGAPARLFRL